MGRGLLSLGLAALLVAAPGALGFHAVTFPCWDDLLFAECRLGTLREGDAHAYPNPKTGEDGNACLPMETRIRADLRYVPLEDTVDLVVEVDGRERQTAEGVGGFARLEFTLPQDCWPYVVSVVGVDIEERAAYVLRLSYRP